MFIALHRNASNRYLHGIRKRIAHVFEHLSLLCDQIAIDASLFGARRIKGKWGRGAYGKTLVCGLGSRTVTAI